MERLNTFTPGFWFSALLHAVVFLFLWNQSQHQMVEIIKKPQVLPDFVVEQMMRPVMQKIEPVSPPPKVTPPKPVVKPPVKMPLKEVQPAPVVSHPKPSEQGEIPLQQEAKVTDAVNAIETAPKTEPEKPKTDAVAKSAPVQLTQTAQSTKDVALTGWAEYGRNLTRACANLKYYPPVAASNHWSGVVIVGVQYSAGGIELSVRQSSGYKILDSAALNMVDQAIKSLPVPDTLKDKPTKIFIPIGFYS